MTSTNKYTDTTAIDYLEVIKRNQLESRKAPNMDFNMAYVTNLESEIGVATTFTNTEKTLADYNIVNNRPYLVAWFPFDYDTYDASNSNHGTVTGVETYVASSEISSTHPLRRGFSFDGSTYITIANESNFDFNRTDDFSISFWVNIGTISSDVMLSEASATMETEASASIELESSDFTIISKINSLTDPGWYVKINSAGYIYFVIQNSTSDQIKVQSTSAIDSNWNHILITYSGSGTASGVTIYVNGSSVSKTTISDTSTATALNNVSPKIGCLTTVTELLTGYLDNLMVYNTALSSTNATDLSAGKNISVDTSINSQKIAAVSNLALLYRFEDNTNDSSTNGNLGTVSGTTTYTDVGKYGKSFSFNGSSYITVADEGDYDYEYNEPFSISLWVKNTSTALDMYVTKADTPTTEGWTFYQTATTGYPEFKFRTASAVVVFTTGVTAVNDGNWHHVVATYSGNSNRSGMKIYVDGSLNATGTSSTALSSTIENSIQVAIGSFYTSGQIYTGEMDDVRIYSKELSSGEVTTLYTNAGQPVAVLGFSDVT